MKKRVLSLVAGATIMLALGASSVSADIGDSCSSATQHVGSKELVYRYAPTVGATYFDEVYGTATAKNLKACSVTASSKITGTYVIPANIQVLGSGTTIYQVGYGRRSSSESTHIVYAYQNSTLIDTGVVVESGDTYRFHIYKRSSGRVSYDVYNVTDGGTVWTYYPTASWGTNLNFVWWGYELHDDHSQIGFSGTNMRAMGYSKESSNPEIDPLIYYRDNLYCKGAPGGNEYDVNKEGMSWWQPGGFTDACPHIPYATIHGAISTTTYTRDTFNAVDLRP